MADTQYELRYLPLFYEDLEQKVIYISEILHNEKAANDLLDAVEKAIMERLPIHPIGENKLKNIDFVHKECTLSIHMQNDKFKGKGYGTIAEQLAIKYAFNEIGLKRVYADTIQKNKRSQHVLEKLGFRFIREDGMFKYYVIER